MKIFVRIMRHPSFLGSGYPLQVLAPIIIGAAGFPLLSLAEERLIFFKEAGISILYTNLFNLHNVNIRSL